MKLNVIHRVVGSEEALKMFIAALRGCKKGQAELGQRTVSQKIKGGIRSRNVDPDERYR